jgi:hypothetical protein
MCLSWCVFLQGQVQFDVEAEAAIQVFTQNMKKGRLFYRIIPEMSDGVRACIQPPNSIICDAFSCYVAVDRARLASIMVPVVHLACWLTLDFINDGSSGEKSLQRDAIVGRWDGHTQNLGGVGRMAAEHRSVVAAERGGRVR